MASRPQEKKRSITLARLHSYHLGSSQNKESSLTQRLDEYDISSGREGEWGVIDTSRLLVDGEGKEKKKRDDVQSRTRGNFEGPKKVRETGGRNREKQKVDGKASPGRGGATRPWRQESGMPNHATKKNWSRDSVRWG